MIEIKEGADLDRAVAEKIGLVATHKTIGSDHWLFIDPRDGTLATPRYFQPSTNLRDAFIAADKVGLFGDRHRVLRKETDETWEIAEVLASSEVIVSSEYNPRLAICAAILRQPTPEKTKQSLKEYLSEQMGISTEDFEILHVRTPRQ